MWKTRLTWSSAVRTKCAWYLSPDLPPAENHHHNKLGERLARENLRLVTLNVDHYFHDLELHPRDEFGDYDFETPQALDMDLINRHLGALFEGQEVRIPYYDFKTGRSVKDHTPIGWQKRNHPD